jgi:mannosyl-oligosaccharide glucosidase
MPRLAQFLSAAVLTLGVAASSKEDAATEIGRLNDESLLWGPYKPNLYFGVRPRLPKGLWTSLMWASVSDYETIGQSMPMPPLQFEVYVESYERRGC